ncbi:hypothetical protein SDC9_41983 [bioreactor metagenome]|uniref:Uncharacterized protein n=1 Tax=bioreactor metagenome TaxID=1076179 RepID=A0A644VWL1_9ZZZZ
MVTLQLALEIHRVARHAEVEDEEDGADEDEVLPVGALPGDVGADRIGDGFQRLEQAHEGDERGVLEHADEGRDDPRDRDLQRLRQDHQPLRLPVIEAERIGRLVLAARQRREPAADHLGDIGGREQRDEDHHPQDDVEVGARRQEVVQQKRGHEQQGDQWHAADELDEHDREGLDQEHVRLPAERQQDAERQRHRDTAGAERDGEQEAAELARGHGLERDRRDPAEDLVDRARHEEPEQHRCDDSAEDREGRAPAGQDPRHEEAHGKARGDHPHRPDRAAPEQPDGEQREHGREFQHPPRQLGEQHRRHRDEHQPEGQHRAPEQLGRVEAEDELRPARADHRPAGAGRALAPALGDDLPALGQRVCGPHTMAEPGIEMADKAPDHGEPREGEHRVQPAREQVLAHPFRQPRLPRGRGFGGKHRLPDEDGTVRRFTHLSAPSAGPCGCRSSSPPRSPARSRGRSASSARSPRVRGRSGSA